MCKSSKGCLTEIRIGDLDKVAELIVTLIRKTEIKDDKLHILYKKVKENLKK